MIALADCLHMLVFRRTAPRAVFDVRSGRNLGRISRPPENLELLGVDPRIGGG